MCKFWLLLTKIDFRTVDWPLGCAQIQFWHFAIISYFPKILSLEWFGSLWDNWCSKFTILNTQCYFAILLAANQNYSENCQNILARTAHFTFFKKIYSFGYKNHLDKFRSYPHKQHKNMNLLRKSNRLTVTFLV